MLSQDSVLLPKAVELHQHKMYSFNDVVGDFYLIAYYLFLNIILVFGLERRYSVGIKRWTISHNETFYMM